MVRDRASKEKQLRWQAEDIVRQAIAKTPAYSKAVKQTIRDLKQTEKSVAKTLQGKKK